MQKKDGTPLIEGYVSLQSEAMPIKFKTVDLLLLKGCTDPKASNYRKHYIANDSSSCDYSTTVVGKNNYFNNIKVEHSSSGNSLINQTQKKVFFELIDLKGNNIVSGNILPGKNKLIQNKQLLGVYVLKIKAGQQSFGSRIVLF